MGFDYSAAVLKPGRLIDISLDMLPGKVSVKLEHLGDENLSYLNDQIAKANAKLAIVASGDKKTQLTLKKLEENRKLRRDILAKHAVRELTATHNNGTAATNDDIPAWVDAIPGDVVDKLWNFANNEELYRDVVVEPDSKALAEK